MENQKRVEAATAIGTLETGLIWFNAKTGKFAGVRLEPGMIVMGNGDEIVPVPANILTEGGMLKSSEVTGEGFGKINLKNYGKEALIKTDDFIAGFEMKYLIDFSENKNITVSLPESDANNIGKEIILFSGGEKKQLNLIIKPADGDCLINYEDKTKLGVKVRSNNSRFALCLAGDGNGCWIVLYSSGINFKDASNNEQQDDGKSKKAK